MPKRIVNSTIVLVRDKKRVTPAIGKAFEFTAKELEQIEKVNKDAVSKLPTPVDETETTKTSESTDSKPTGNKPGTGAAAKDAKSNKAGSKDDDL